MVTNSKLKKATRERMAETGEKYMVARRRILEAQEAFRQLPGQQAGNEETAEEA